MSHDANDLRRAIHDERAKVGRHVGRHRAIRVPPAAIVDLYDTILLLVDRLEDAETRAAHVMTEPPSAAKRAPLTPRSMVRP